MGKRNGVNDGAQQTVLYGLAKLGIRFARFVEAGGD